MLLTSSAEGHDAEAARAADMRQDVLDVQGSAIKPKL